MDTQFSIEKDLVTPLLLLLDKMKNREFRKTISQNSMNFPEFFRISSKYLPNFIFEFYDTFTQHS